ncbi:MAG: hypothetical protein ACE369_03685 [Roseovarius sp.]
MRNATTTMERLSTQDAALAEMLARHVSWPAVPRRDRRAVAGG